MKTKPFIMKTIHQILTGFALLIGLTLTANADFIEKNDNNFVFQTDTAPTIEPDDEEQEDSDEEPDC